VQRSAGGDYVLPGLRRPEAGLLEEVEERTKAGAFAEGTVQSVVPGTPSVWRFFGPPLRAGEC
jgi:hypothetical protein